MIGAAFQFVFANTTYSRWMQPHSHAQKHSVDWHDWVATHMSVSRARSSRFGGGRHHGEGADEETGTVAEDDESTGVWDGAVVVSDEDPSKVSVPHESAGELLVDAKVSALTSSSSRFVLSLRAIRRQTPIRGGGGGPRP